MVLGAFASGFVEAVLVNVHKGDDVVSEGDSLRVRLAFAIGPDDGDVKALASCVLAAKQEIGGGEETSGHAGGGAEETAT